MTSTWIVRGTLGIALWILSRAVGRNFSLLKTGMRIPISACPSANDSPFRLTAEGFEAWLEVPTVGTYRVEVSSDLRSWESLVTLTNVSGRVRVLDPTAKDAPQRFYRAVQVP